MAAIKIPTSFNIDVEFEIPEFYRRLISLIIDIVIETCYLMVALRIYWAIVKNSRLDDDAYYNLEAVWLILLLPLLLYHVILEITMNGQSFGKKIMRIKVVNEKGGRPGISQFLIRWLLRISDVWVVILVILVAQDSLFGQSLESRFIGTFAFLFLVTDVILILASKKRQRIGDLLARTILIRTNTKVSIEETVFQEVADDYSPSFPMIMQLSDRDINAIKSILETAKRKGDFQMASAASDKIKSHLNIETQLSPFEFLEILLKDYNYLSVK